MNSRRVENIAYILIVLLDINNNLNPWIFIRYRDGVKICGNYGYLLKRTVV